MDVRSTSDEHFVPAESLSRSFEALPVRQAARCPAASVPVYALGERKHGRQRSSRVKAYASYSELPMKLRANEYIKSGYRVELNVWGSLKSIFGVHNESGNIWTHLIGQFADLWTRFVLAHTSKARNNLEDLIGSLQLVFHRLCNLSCSNSKSSICQGCTLGGAYLSTSWCLRKPSSKTSFGHQMACQAVAGIRVPSWCYGVFADINGLPSLCMLLLAHVTGD